MPAAANAAAVHDHGVAIGAGEDDRIVRADGIEVCRRRHAAFRPAGLDPAAAVQKNAWLHPIKFGADPGDQLRNGGRAFEGEVQLPLANAHQVGMGIGKARIHEGALEIDEIDLGLVPVFRQRRRRADDAAIFADHDGIDGRKIRISGIDRAAGEDGQALRRLCLCRLWCLARTTGRKGQG
jgi:hypothetical protein